MKLGLAHLEQLNRSQGLLFWKFQDFTLRLSLASSLTGDGLCVFRSGEGRLLVMLVFLLPVRRNYVVRGRAGDITDIHSSWGSRWVRHRGGKSIYLSHCHGGEANMPLPILTGTLQPCGSPTQRCLQLTLAWRSLGRACIQGPIPFLQSPPQLLRCGLAMA